MNTKVSAAVILSADNVLCVQRPRNAQKHVSLKWEFPGGKVEHDEDQIQALKREIHEELQLEIKNIELVATVEHTYPDFHLVMHAYTCEISSEEPELTEHVDLKWLSLEKLNQLDWAAADIPVVKFLEVRG